MSTTCPCCLFLPEDLFLPDPRDEPTDDDNVGSNDFAEVVADAAMLNPLEALDQLSKLKRSVSSICLVDTHGHAHLGREGDVGADIYQAKRQNAESVPVASLTCAVAPQDWKTCIDYASQSPHRAAALGVHPWYVAALSDTWLDELEHLLLEHPGCLVGEIGLCKQARFLRTYEGGKQEALEIQRRVFAQQLQLAATLHRGVSIHCVNQHGVLLDVFKAQQDNLPSAMALHSFTGTAHQVKQLLKWEDSMRRPQPLLYFGFSHSVNYAMCSSEKSRRQGRLAVQAVPRNRLLAESDVHREADVAGGTAGAVAFLAWARGETLEEIASLTAANGLAFLSRAHEALS